MDSTFEKNLQALDAQNHELASKIRNIDTNDKFDVFIGKDESSINIIRRFDCKYVYENPTLDTKKFIDGIETQKQLYPSLFFYGIGNGVFLKYIFTNQNHKKIVVFDPEIELIYIVLNLIDLSSHINNDELIIFWTKELSSIQCHDLIMREYILTYIKTYDLNIINNFYDEYSDDIKNVNQMMLKTIHTVVQRLGNDIKDVLNGIYNHNINSIAMVNNYKFAELIIQRRGLVKTAVIASTGPSLTKQLPILKKYAPYVTILCPDASFTILYKNGIKPDYVTTVERLEWTAWFYYNNTILEQSNQSPEEYEAFVKDIFFISSSLAHKQTIDVLTDHMRTDVKISLAMKGQAYEEGFGLDEYGYVDGSGSASNMAYSMACLLGFENIVFIGQDLSFSNDGTSHAQDHIYSQTDIKSQEHNLYTTAYGGDNTVKTTQIWNLFRSIFETSISEAKLYGIKTFNCTEGGSRIEGSIERPFAELMNELCKDVEPKNLPTPQKPKPDEIKANIKHINKHINEIIKYGENFAFKIGTLLAKIVKICNRAIEIKEPDELMKFDFRDVNEVIQEIDRLKTQMKESKFTYMYSLACISYIYHVEFDIAKIAVLPYKTDLEKRQKAINMVFVHRKWAMALLGIVKEQIKVVKDSRAFLAKQTKRCDQKCY